MVAAAYRTFAKSLRCWLVLLACCGYAVCSGIVATWVPLYATDQLGVTHGTAARLMIFLTIGSLVGNCSMALVRDHCSLRVSLLATVAAVVVSSSVALVWLSAAHEMSSSCTESDMVCHAPVWLSVELLGAMLLVLSASVEGLWTINVGVYILSFGGRTHASTLSGVTDFASYAVAAPLMLVAGALVAADDYLSMICMVFVCLLFAHVCMVVFLALEVRAASSSKPA